MAHGMVAAIAYVMELNNRKVIDVEAEGDLDDGYFVRGYYEDGTELTEAELDQLGDLYSDVLYEMLYENVVGAAEAYYDSLTDR